MSKSRLTAETGCLLLHGARRQLVDFTVSYCIERRDLEERNWNLVGRLAVLTDRLMLLAGVDHDEFSVTKVMCADVRDEISIAREGVIRHRTDHGC